MKYWKLNTSQLKDMSAAIDDVNKVAKGWQHGGNKATTIHNKLGKLINDSNSLREFKYEMRKWAPEILKNGVDDLQKFFRF
ncbi:hypothetical protein ACFL27_22890 [candidate division CSSED10-310 bacterium]|uniref:Uncharacterized protein n=1 Tax=candidate division CSSED10-310 bacterium TaxID=2855610 RepID=A0ABV6Z3N2_UNCC1